MLATKPVATLGTSRARAAESASALRAVVVARMSSRFRLVTLASGMTHERVPAMWRCAGGRSPDLEIGLAETWKGLADSEIMEKLQWPAIKPRTRSAGDIRSASRP